MEDQGREETPPVSGRKSHNQRTEAVVKLVFCPSCFQLTRADMRRPLVGRQERGLGGCEASFRRRFSGLEVDSCRFEAKMSIYSPRSNRDGHLT